MQRNSAPKIFTSQADFLKNMMERLLIKNKGIRLSLPYMGLQVTGYLTQVYRGIQAHSHTKRPKNAMVQTNVPFSLTQECILVTTFCLQHSASEAPPKARRRAELSSETNVPCCFSSGQTVRCVGSQFLNQDTTHYCCSESTEF